MKESGGVVRSAPLRGASTALRRAGPVRRDRHASLRGTVAVASLNHVAIVLAIAFWSWAWGTPGMLLAVPLLMTIKAVCDHVEGLKGFGEFLGE